MKRCERIIQLPVLLAAVFASGLIGTTSFGFQERLSPFTTTTFVPDGNITEFIQFSGDPQNYFVTSSLAGTDFGAILAQTIVTPGVFVRRDNSPVPGTISEAGPTGFLDRPAGAGSQSLPTGFNVGRVFVSYNPDAYGGQNGGAYFLAFDNSAPSALDAVAGTQPIAFDIDGDGNRQTQTEVAAPGSISDAPLNADKINREGYSLRINTDGVGSHEATITIGEQVEFLPDGAVPIDPNGKAQVIDGFDVRRYVLFRDSTGKMVGTPQQLALLFLDANNDGVLDYRDFGVGADVELVIRNVSLLPRNSTAPTCATFTYIADSFDDQSLGGGAEESITLAATFPVPAIEVTKDARCVGEPDGAFRSEVHVTPGSQVEYRVAIQNWGNVPLNVTMTDLLGCEAPATSSFVAGSCAIVGVRPAGVPANFCDQLSAAFGMPGEFPQLPVGRLEAASACAVGAGEKLTFTFRSLVGPSGANPAFCDQAIDCSNRVSVSATMAVAIDPILPPDPTAGISADDEEQHCQTAQCCAGVPGCIPGDAIGDVADEFSPVVTDVYGVIDTPREQLAGRDDNGVGVEIECRGINMTKEVRQLPSGSFVSELTRVDLPAAPIDIEFRYTVANTGEVPEQVTLEDAGLCQDIATVLAAHPGGLTLANCPICTGQPQGQVVGVVPAGGPSLVSTCRINFVTEGAVRAFMLADDSRTACRALNQQGAADPFCHRNCASVRATSGAADGVCGNAEQLIDDSFATVCHEFCDITVTKTAQCQDCNTRTLSGTAATTLSTTRGSCTDFAVTIHNNNATTSICALRVTDTLSGAPANIIFDSNVRITRGGQNCTIPPGFNVTGSPFVIDLPTVCGGALAPGQDLVIRFSARIPANADSGVSPRNVVNVDGASFCAGGTPSFTCMGNADSTVDILNPQLSCQSKTWEIQSDTDGDCNPDGAFHFGSDLGSAVFPVVLRFTLKATNTGDVPLSVTADDVPLRNCVNSLPGVEFAQGQPCELGVAKPIAAGAMGEWVCAIRIDSVAAFDQLDACDGMANGQFRNSASVTGVVSAGSNVCVGANASASCPGGLDTPVNGPRDCDMVVNKQVKCKGQPDIMYTADVDVVPGSTQTFRIQVTNGPEGSLLPQICLTDVLTCNTLFVPNSVAANIAGTDVTACIQPGFTTGVGTGARRCFTFDTCRPAAPWIAPNETLTITFDVFVPNAFGQLGVDPDCRNNVTVDGYSDACQEAPSPAEACDTGTGQAQFDVRVPRLLCSKEVCIDDDGIGGCDEPYANEVSLGPEADFPLTVKYRFTVLNNGETSLTGVEFCDSELLSDLVQAGINTINCQLTPPSGCTAGTTLSPGTNVMRTCDITFATREAWEAFAVRDADHDEDCYINSGRATGDVDAAGVCSSVAIAEAASGLCEARVCIAAPPEGACCRLDGRCDVASERECELSAGLYNGDNTECLGDHNGNQIDDACEERIPTVSAWGAAVLALLLLIGSKLRFNRQLT